MSQIQNEQQIAISWQLFEQSQLNGQDVPAFVRRRMRDAFYAGAGCMFLLATEDIPNGPGSDVGPRIIAISEELTTYFGVTILEPELSPLPPRAG